MAHPFFKSMNSIPVPETLAPAGTADITEIVDFLISGLLHASPAILHGTLSDSDSKVLWHLDTSSSSAQLHEMKKSIFRSVLARIGFHYMGSKMYGGTTSVVLTQTGKSFQTLFEMSNSGPTGFWVKITTQSEG